jgi:hypothetical protein
MVMSSFYKSGIHTHCQQHAKRRLLRRGLVCPSVPLSSRLANPASNIQRYTALVPISRSSLSSFVGGPFILHGNFQSPRPAPPPEEGASSDEGYAARVLAVASASPYTRNSLFQLHPHLSPFQRWGQGFLKCHQPFISIVGVDSARWFSSLIEVPLLNEQQKQRHKLQLQNRHGPYEQRVSMSSSSSSSETPKGSFSTHAKIPTPKVANPTSSSPLASFDVKAMARSIVDLTWSITKMVARFILNLPGNTLFFLTHPKERRDKIVEIRDIAKKEFDHYYIGTKVNFGFVISVRRLTQW